MLAFALTSQGLRVLLLHGRVFRTGVCPISHEFAKNTSHLSCGYWLSTSFICDGGNEIVIGRILKPGDHGLLSRSGTIPCVKSFLLLVHLLGWITADLSEDLMSNGEVVIKLTTFLMTSIALSCSTWSESSFQARSSKRCTLADLVLSGMAPD
jgi:hypothetical protein